METGAVCTYVCHVCGQVYHSRAEELKGRLPMWLFLLFVMVPIIEIALFIQVGGAIGLWPTLAIVVLTAIIGTALMRAQGVMALNRLQQAIADGGDPGTPLIEGAMILVAGVLLLTPGFFTDTVGLLLLLPPVRMALIRWGSARVLASGFTFVSTGSAGPARRPDRDTIEAEYSVLDDDDQEPPENPSGWAKR
ncbi:MAG: FxsA family protein [Rhodobacteraceae bacterium]|nr:FxsA family protein [Paracoccaceae bacterium]